ncbi:hypothetical protein CHS0354_023017 [Potamilus streckersoni]|uniref:Uncharacterized protein n=1 Tax=Potamilus streckersoni TaxID=2493646 RepID=A0AAE0SUT8_9BIVA|nr:hypothetical protein CHS0354_023017 [Potamilus streckersoni]
MASGNPVENVWEKWDESTWDSFCKWFWKEKNGNQLIEKLNFWNGTQNKWKGDFDKIRREKDSPTIYSIVVNDDKNLGSIWKFCKVGYTGISTKIDSKNRMEELIKKVKYEKRKSKYEDASVLFKLPINATDSLPVRTTEERIREDFGWKVDATLAEKLRLPNKTEWILNTASYLKAFKEVYKSIKKSVREDLTTAGPSKKPVPSDKIAMKEPGKPELLSTKVFKDRKEIKFTNYVKENRKTMDLKEWLTMESFPKWLDVKERKEKPETYEVYLKEGVPLPLELQNMLDNIDS